jgi:hypothetical protein
MALKIFPPKKIGENIAGFWLKFQLIVQNR